MDEFLNKDQTTVQDRFLFMLHDRIIQLEEKFDALRDTITKCARNFTTNDNNSKFTYYLCLNSKQYPSVIKQLLTYTFKFLLDKCDVSNIKIIGYFNEDNNSISLDIQVDKTIDISETFAAFISSDHVSKYLDPDYTSYVADFTKETFVLFDKYDNVECYIVYYDKVGMSYFERIRKVYGKRRVFKNRTSVVKELLNTYPDLLMHTSEQDTSDSDSVDNWSV
jgi:hypothetical protein